LDETHTGGERVKF